MIDSVPGTRGPRTSQSSGGGTFGNSTHEPSTGMSRMPRAAFTVTISVSATWPTTRAWVTLWPLAPMVTSMSRMDGGWA
jgi:hypothetical protein